jgi:hypothetical protein
MQDGDLTVKQSNQNAPDPKIKVPSEYWDELKARDRTSLSNLTLFTPHASGGLLFRFLREDVLVDMKKRCLKQPEGRSYKVIKRPLLELVILLYMINVKTLHPFGKDIVGPKDLKEGHFFRGPHGFRAGSLAERYGNDLDGFKMAAEYLGGKSMDMADMAYMLLPFPRVPLYYLIWKGDEDFSLKISVLFDRSIEDCLPASGIWGLENLVTSALLSAPEDRL